MRGGQATGKTLYSEPGPLVIERQLALFWRRLFREDIPGSYAEGLKLFNADNPGLFTEWIAARAAQAVEQRSEIVAFREEVAQTEKKVEEDATRDYKVKVGFPLGEDPELVTALKLSKPLD